MTLKGKEFSGADFPRRSRLSEQQKAVKAQALTERYRVVAMDGSIPVIAEEVQERILRRLDELRPFANDLLVKLTAAQRVRLFAAFDEHGELRNPLTPV